MITDKLATLADDTALNTGAAGSYIIGDVIDLGVVGKQLFNVDGLFLVAKVQTTATSGGSATLNLQLVTDDNASMSSPTVVFSLPAAVAVASLTAGALLAIIPLPIGFNFERYIGLQQVTGTAAFTAGKVDVFLTTTPPAWRAYADGRIAGTYG